MNDYLRWRTKAPTLRLRLLRVSCASLKASATSSLKATATSFAVLPARWRPRHEYRPPLTPRTQAPDGSHAPDGSATLQLCPVQSVELDGPASFLTMRGRRESVDCAVQLAVCRGRAAPQLTPLAALPYGAASDAEARA